MNTMALPKKVETVPSNKYGAFQWDDPLLLEESAHRRGAHDPRHGAQLLRSRS